MTESKELNRTLYTDEFLRSLPELQRYKGNPAVAMLCKTESKPWAALRSTIEDYFAGLSAKEQTKFTGPLRAQRNATWCGHFYELIMGLALRTLGFQVQHDPQIGGLTPDMLVSKDDCRFVCEVRTLFDSKERSGNEKILQDIDERLSRHIRSHYVISLHYGQFPPKVDVRRLVREVAACIAQQTEETFNQQIVIDGFPMRISGIRADNGKAAGIRGRSCVGFWGDSSNRLRKELKEKAEKYRDTGYPLVLAVCDPGDFQDLGTLDALYGEEVRCSCICGDAGADEVVSRRKNNGLFSLPGTERQHRQPHVSGVLEGRLDTTSDSVLLNLVYYANHDITNPVPDNTFTGIPRRIVQKDEDGQFSLICLEPDAPPLRLV